MEQEGNIVELTDLAEFFVKARANTEKVLAGRNNDLAKITPKDLPKMPKGDQ
jgi:hypothetical protein